MRPNIVELEPTGLPDVCDTLDAAHIDKTLTEINDVLWAEANGQDLCQNARDKSVESHSTPVGQCSVDVIGCHVIDGTNQIKYNMCASCVGHLSGYSCSAGDGRGAKTTKDALKTSKSGGEKEENSDEDDEEDAAPDGGWGWVVAFGCFVVAFLVDLLGPCFSIIFSNLLLSLRSSSTSVAWLYNLRAFLFNMVTLFLGPLVSEFGWRLVAFVAGAMCALGLGISAFATSSLLLLTYSILTGIGGGLLMGIIFAIIPHYFKKRRGIANALMMVGLCAGQMAGPHLINYLQTEYTYLGGTLVLSAIVLNCCVGATVFQPVEWHQKMKTKPRDANQNSEKTPASEKEQSSLARVFTTTVSNLQLLKEFRVLIIALSSALNMISYMNFLMMVPFSMQSSGFTLQEASWCVSVSGMCNVISRLVTSLLTDCPGFSMRACYISGTTLILVGMIAFSFLDDLLYLTVVMALWGCGVGAFMSIYSLVMVEYVGLAKLVPTLGVCGLFNAFGFLISGTLTGYIRDISGSYSMSIWILSCSLALSIVLWFLMPVAVRYDKETQERKMEISPS